MKMIIKKKILIASLIAFLFLLNACGGTNTQDPQQSSAGEQASGEEPANRDEDLTEGDEDSAEKPNDEQVTVEGEEAFQGGENMIYAYIGENVLVIEPADNSSSAAFMDLLKSGDVTVSMSDYGGFEKVGALGTSLPANDERITTEPGDVILYQGNQITIYYDTNTWSFTRLGKVNGLSRDELKAALGEGAVDVRFSLKNIGGGENIDQTVNGASSQAGVGVFDFDKKTVLLNSGYEMPIMGLGTYSLDYDTCVNSVKALLESGGRLIDTAYMYNNEEAVGEGVRQAMEEYNIPREEIFVITKIYPSQFGNPEAAIDMALEKLNIDYIDMMLLHHPGTNDVEAYKAMEKYVEAGQIKSLGLSNWYIEELTEFLPEVNIVPALVQNEIHPYYQEQDVVPFIQDKGIVVQCWYPLGGRGYTKELLGDETINSIAESHGVSPAQVILRWDLQRGIVVIPGSSNPEHIKENLALFDFHLTEEEMNRINALDRNEKHDWY